MSALAGSSVLAVAADKVAPGLLGFLVVAALGAATWLLIKSMNKQLKKIDFDESESETERAHRVPEENSQNLSKED